MSDSTYTKMLKMMRVQGAKYNPDGIEIGTVITSNPLTIQLDGLPLNRDNLLSADYLLIGYSRTVTIPSTDATEINFTDGLKKDDQVALIKINKTKYLILCRIREA